MSHFRDVRRRRYDHRALRNKEWPSEANKAPGNISLVLCLQGSQQPCQVSKEGHFLAGSGTAEYFGDLEKGGIHPNLQVSQAKSDGKSLAWLSGLKRLLGAQSEIPYEKFQQKSSWFKRDGPGTRMVSHCSCCTYVNKQAKFLETRLTLQTN